MLHEHVLALRELFAEEELERKPMLDEQQIILNERLLLHAYHHKLPIKITYFSEGSFMTKEGKVTHIDPREQTVSLAGESILLPNIIEINESNA